MLELAKQESIKKRFWSKVDKTGDCWLWLGALTEGYGQFGIGRKNIHAHRFAYEITYGPLPNGYFACHNCDNPPCVRPDHLFAGTNGHNMQDAYDKGRGPNQCSCVYKGITYVSQKELWRRKSIGSVSYKTFVRRLKYLNWSLEDSLIVPPYCGNNIRGRR